ncbi:arginase family protein [Prolixibacteraceae bacterium]|nr:arginase family protein [Prolixibacteraceae bacterium]
MELVYLLEPVDYEQFPSAVFADGKLGAKIKHSTETLDLGEFSKNEVVILGVLELETSNLGQDNYHAMREALYNMFDHFPELKIRDIGNVKSGRTKADSRVALSEVVKEVISKGGLPIVLGNYSPLFQVLFADSRQDGNVVWFDSRIPALESDEICGWNYHLQDADKKMLIILGTQKYLNSQKNMDDFQSFGGQHLGVGKIRDNIRLVEPELRDATAVGIHLDVMKSVDTPGGVTPHPNGLTSTEVCQMMWYYGMGNRPTSLSLWGYHVDFDPTLLGAYSVAQMIWHFLLGLESYDKDFIVGPGTDSMEHYVIPLDSYGVVLYFMKHKISERWWFAVQYNNLRSDYVSCLREDYEFSRKGEISERLWRYIVHKRMSVVHKDNG